MLVLITLVTALRQILSKLALFAPCALHMNVVGVYRLRIKFKRKRNTDIYYKKFLSKNAQIIKQNFFIISIALLFYIHRELGLKTRKK